MGNLPNSTGQTLNVKRSGENIKQRKSDAMNRKVGRVVVSMDRRLCRQVLECGDGVRGVTALSIAAFKIPKRTPDKATLAQSGDSEDSVAVQDARAPTRGALGSCPMRGRSTVEALNKPGARDLSRRSVRSFRERGSRPP